mmetsp:Transcript_5102/g.9753  ORF Transcript_5102/g.9753 Transcript_5102/m.9753 type:complete len:394 (-) Transcript_5102:70-1251(-)
MPTPEKPKHSMKGIFLIMLGAFSFSIMFLTVKIMASTNTFTLVFYRSLVQIAISLSTLLKKRVNPLGPPGVRLQLVARAVFGGVAVAAWFYGIQILPLPDAVTLQFTTPAFAAAFGVIMVGEQWKPLDMIGAVVCISGVALIAHPTWLFGGDAEVADEDGPSPFIKMLAVLITSGGAASAGFAYVMVRVIGARADAIGKFSRRAESMHSHRTSSCATGLFSHISTLSFFGLAVMVLYYAVLSIPLCYFGSGFIEGDWAVWQLQGFGIADYILLLLMGLGGYGGQWFTNLGLQNETAATATLATSTQIVWTYIFEIMFLHEAINSWSLGGTGLILGYMILVGAIKMVEANEGVPKSPSDGDITDCTDADEATGLLQDVEQGQPNYRAANDDSGN